LESIEGVASEGALLSTSSSGLAPHDVFGRVRRLDRCIVTHPLNPPELIPLVELVPAPRRAPARSRARRSICGSWAASPRS